MAATNRDLEAEIKAQRFRLDLYYRLAVVTLNLPPLRERREDIPALVESYLKHFSTLLRKPVTAISPPALEAMMAYEWPGNVRELINVMERAILLGQGPTIDLPDLPPGLTVHEPPAAGPRGGRPEFLPVRLDRPLLAARRDLVDRFEHAYLTALLQATGGRVGVAARRAGLDSRSLYTLIKKHGLRRAAFKPDLT
jgi:DNA-binding NtrC family response regulator